MREEARRTGEIDAADDDVEKLFKPQYQTVNSPAHRAVWDRGLPVELFQCVSTKAPDEVRKVMDDSIEVVRQTPRSANTLYDAHGKITATVMAESGRRPLLGFARRSRVRGQRDTVSRISPRS